MRHRLAGAQSARVQDDLLARAQTGNNLRPIRPAAPGDDHFLQRLAVLHDHDFLDPGKGDERLGGHAQALLALVRR